LSPEEERETEDKKSKLGLERRELFLKEKTTPSRPTEMRGEFEEKKEAAAGKEVSEAVLFAEAGAEAGNSEEDSFFPKIKKETTVKIKTAKIEKMIIFLFIIG